MSATIRINAQISIPRRELRFSFVRSSGPGGQNVNKVASKAVLRWVVTRSSALPDAVRRRFLVTHARRINDRGELVLASQRFRDQAKNVDDCLDKLRAMVVAAAKPRRQRKTTRVPKSAIEARLKQKKATSEKKRRRSPPMSEQ